MTRFKILVIFLALFCFCSFARAQKDIIVQTDSSQITLKYSPRFGEDNLMPVYFPINLSVVNNSDSSIEFPKSRYASSKDPYFQHEELTITIIKIQSREERFCPGGDINYGVVPPMQIIKPGQSGKITAVLFGDCFNKKGIYEVRFNLKIIIGESKSRIASSNPVIIRVI